MITRELILTEIEQIEREDWDEFYLLIKKFIQSKAYRSKSSLMSRLKAITIDAPEDFATNLDLYTSGQKDVEANLC
jgi:hypothetical protein